MPSGLNRKEIPEEFGVRWRLEGGEKKNIHKHKEHEKIC